MLKPLLHICCILAALLAGVVALACTAFATRGGELAYEGDRAGNWEIYLLDLSTGISFNLTRSPANELDPAWSPDGTQLAFSADTDADLQPELYLISANGAGGRRISGGSSGYRSPGWSADGTSLVFVLGFGQIYRMDTDGGNERRLGAGFLPSLSADAQWLLYSAESTSTLDADIYRERIATHEIINLTNNTSNEWGARWSPDGTQIAFSALRGGRTRVYVMDANGGSLRAVTDTGGNDNDPAWSPDGTQIAFASEVDGAKQLYVVDADGGNLRRVTDGTSNHQSPAWRPLPR
jgi:TolB protein